MKRNRWSRTPRKSRRRQMNEVRETCPTTRKAAPGVRGRGRRVSGRAGEAGSQFPESPTSRGRAQSPRPVLPCGDAGLPPDFPRSPQQPLTPDSRLCSPPAAAAAAPARGPRRSLSNRRGRLPARGPSGAADADNLSSDRCPLPLGPLLPLGPSSQATPPRPSRLPYLSSPRLRPSGWRWGRRPAR